MDIEGNPFAEEGFYVDFWQWDLIEFRIEIALGFQGNMVT